MTRLIAPIDGATIAILNELQRKFISEDVHELAYLEQYKERDDTFPQLNLFQWETDYAESTIEISENIDFLEPRVIQTTNQNIMLHNFKANKTYYWRVNGCEPSSFRTEDVAPCFYEVEGISNVRDVGNWHTKYECRIKQGLLFRGSEMNVHHTITEKGIDVMRDNLKIHTDLDLRASAKQFTCSPLGEDIQFLVVPAGPYVDFLENKVNCKRLFNIFADENNYPIYYHCWAGADRTGTLACMLGAILGMCEKDMLLDYEITSLSVWGDRNHVTDQYQTFRAELDQYEGEKFEDKIMSFIYSCGITEEQLEKIRDILLD